MPGDGNSSTNSTAKTNIIIYILCALTTLGLSWDILLQQTTHMPGTGMTSNQMKWTVTSDLTNIR